MDGLLSIASNCAQAVVIFPSIFPNVQLHSSKTIWFTQKELKLIPTCPTLTKVLLQGSILIYIDGLLSVAPNCAQAAIFLLPYSRTFNCTSKRLAGSPKGAEIDPNLPHANKSVTKVAHAFLYTWMDFFNRTTSPSRCYLTFFHIPNVQF
jgi:hypothetical protein